MNIIEQLIVSKYIDQTLCENGLFINDFKSTKRFDNNLNSYDDRTYIRFIV